MHLNVFGLPSSSVIQGIPLPFANGIDFGRCDIKKTPFPE